MVQDLAEAGAGAGAEAATVAGFEVEIGVEALVIGGSIGWLIGAKAKAAKVTKAAKAVLVMSGDRPIGGSFGQREQRTRKHKS